MKSVGMAWWDSAAMVCALSAVLLAQSNSAPVNDYQRTFPQSKAEVEKALKQLLPASAGHLPVLDGFTVPGERALDRYQRAYYQCTAEVSATPSGGTLVRVSAKITAWYADSDVSKSGYRVLPSNGRLESDFLDGLQDALADKRTSAAPPTTKGNSASSTTGNASPPRSTKALDASAPTISAPMPGGSTLADAIAASKTPTAPEAPPLNATIPATDDVVASLRTKKAVEDKRMEELTKEAKGLEEILRHQSHPDNLVAVKQSGTPVLAGPSEGAKVLFLASAEDEFEILDLNASWVHVRISGLSRGWIRRSSVEMPEAFASAETPNTAAMDRTPPPDGKEFQVESEETASFPGDWPPLSGRTVAIVSVQKSNPNASGGGSQAKMEFAKDLFDKKYKELMNNPGKTEGVVLVFDSADGGMVAATLPLLQEWRAGNLSDEAFWRRCYFDPPELFRSSGQ